VLLLVALLGLIGWGVLAGIPVERRLVPVLVRQARGRPWRGALVSLGVQLGALAGYGIAVLVAQLLGRPLLVVIESAAILAYLPVLMTAIPAEFSGYAPARREMQRAGASRGVARAIAWSGGPVAVAGLICVLVTLITLLEPA
jgi:hypothetical protein